jgi:hypothetical protein
MSVCLCAYAGGPLQRHHGWSHDRRLPAAAQWAAACVPLCSVWRCTAGASVFGGCVFVSAFTAHSSRSHDDPCAYVCMCGPLADTQAIIEGLGITLSKMTSPPPPSMPFPQPGPGEGGMPGLPPPPPLGLGPDTAVPAGGEPAAATSGSSGGGWFSWLTGSGEETKANAAGRVDVASARAPNSFEHALVTLVLLVRKPTERAALPLSSSSSSSSRCRSQRSLPLKCTRFMTRALCLRRLRLTMPSTTSSSNSTDRSVTTRRGRQQQQRTETCHLAPVCRLVSHRHKERTRTRPRVGVIICSHQCANIEASAAAEAIQ